MREVSLEKVSKKITDFLIDANCSINDDLEKALIKARNKEISPLGIDVLDKIIENHNLGKKTKSPICQDTGIVVVFIEIGNEVFFKGNLNDAVNKGVENAYKLGYLRKSVVNHPLERINTKTNTPAIIHYKIVEGDIFMITVVPKGGGSENMSLVKMLTPSEGVLGIKNLVLETIFKAGGKPCPPIIVGLGIGGNLEKSALLAKEALLRDLDDEAEDKEARILEKELLEAINNLGIGPMGFGGVMTCLAVKVNIFPCHIASLPVAINIQCHAARHKTILI